MVQMRLEMWVFKLFAFLKVFFPQEGQAVLSWGDLDLFCFLLGFSMVIEGEISSRHFITYRDLVSTESHFMYLTGKVILRTLSRRFVDRYQKAL